MTKIVIEAYETVGTLVFTSDKYEVEALPNGYISTRDVMSYAGRAANEVRKKIQAHKKEQAEKE